QVQPVPGDSRSARTGRRGRRRRRSRLPGRARSRRMLDDLFAHMGRSGMSRAEAQGHLAQWAEEDFYATLPEELALIREAGFERPDVFWRDGLIAVYGAFKDD